MRRIPPAQTSVRIVRIAYIYIYIRRRPLDLTDPYGSLFAAVSRNQPIEPGPKKCPAHTRRIGQGLPAQTLV